MGSSDALLPNQSTEALTDKKSEDRELPTVYDSTLLAVRGAHSGRDLRDR